MYLLKEVHIFMFNSSIMNHYLLIIRPPMVLVEKGLNSKQVPLMLVLKQMVLIAKVVLISSGLYSRTLLYSIFAKQLYTNTIKLLIKEVFLYCSHLMGEASSMTDGEREHIDTEAQNIIKKCQDSLNTVKKNGKDEFKV